MKEYIKSYHVFLSARLFQVAIYVLYPLVAIFCVSALIGIALSFNMGIGAGYQLSANLLLVGEVVCGYLIFGGIADKDTNKLEYLKTSVKGMRVLKTAMIVDVVRRILWVTIIQLVPLFIFQEKSDESIWIANAMILLFAEICCLFIRKSSLMAMLLGVIVGGTTFLSPLLGLATLLDSLLWLIVLCYILVAVVMFINIKMVMKKARDSFYDVRSEKVPETD